MAKIYANRTKVLLVALVLFLITIYPFVLLLLMDDRFYRHFIATNSKHLKITDKKAVVENGYFVLRKPLVKFNNLMIYPNLSMRRTSNSSFHPKMTMKLNNSTKNSKAPVMIRKTSDFSIHHKPAVTFENSTTNQEVVTAVRNKSSSSVLSKAPMKSNNSAINLKAQRSVKNASRFSIKKRFVKGNVLAENGLPETNDQSSNQSDHHPLGSYQKSIIFLKSFKVGGTTISSLLTAYAFNTRRRIGPISRWCRGKPSNRSPRHCSDVAGTDHPHRLPCDFQAVNSPIFCKPVAVFIMLRDPVERLWSGYRHEVKIAGGEAFPLKRFLDSKTIVKTPSNHLLNKMDTEKAIQKAKSINVLLYHLYDESLVYMATRTGLTLCDIMYVPCDNASWHASKCNQNTTVTMSETDRQVLRMETNKTGEKRFYNTLANSAELYLKSDDIIRQTEIYRKLRSTALNHCKDPEVLMNIVNMFESKSLVWRDKHDNKLYHLRGEKIIPLDPMTVCLGQYCHKEISSKLENF